MKLTKRVIFLLTFLGIFVLVKSKETQNKPKKRRNSHLDRKVELNGHQFEIERAIVEKKRPRHGVEPEIGADGSKNPEAYG